MTDLTLFQHATATARAVLWQPKTMTSSRWGLLGVGMGLGGGMRDLAVSLKEASAMSQTFEWDGAEKGGGAV